MSINNTAKKTATPYILFDIDHTLYHPETGVENACVDRITQLIAEKLNISLEAADAVRECWYLKYGSAFEGIEKFLGISPHLISDFVYERGIDLSVIPPNPTLKRELERLVAAGHRLAVLSNGSCRHAERVLEHLGISHLFERVWGFDSFAHGICKPNHNAFRHVMAEWQVKPEEMTLVEDSTSNLRTAEKLGIAGRVLIRPNQPEAGTLTGIYTAWAADINGWLAQLA